MGLELGSVDAVNLDRAFFRRAAIMTGRGQKGKHLEEPNHDKTDA